MMARTGSFGSRLRSGFSLVEVTITLGIAVFALVTMVALFQSLFTWSRGIGDRRQALQSMDALTAFLNDTNSVTFSNAFAWATNGTNGTNLTFIRYRDSNSRIAMLWTTNSADVAQHEATREGRLIKAAVFLSPNNPGTLPVPTDLTNYTNSRIVFQVNYHAVSDPNQTLNSNNLVLTAHQTVFR